MGEDHGYGSLVSHLRICNLPAPKSSQVFQEESNLVKSVCHTADLRDKVKNDNKKPVDGKMFTVAREREGGDWMEAVE